MTYPSFNSVPDQIALLRQLLSATRVTGTVGDRIAARIGALTNDASHEAINTGGNPFTQRTIVIPGFEPQLMSLFAMSTHQQNIGIQVPQPSICESSQDTLLHAGDPRVVAVNLIAHQCDSAEDIVDFDALIVRKDSYLSAIATLWMIMLNPAYAMWLACEQTSYDFIILPGLTRQSEKVAERIVLVIDLRESIFDFRWCSVPNLPKHRFISPVVSIDPCSKHLDADTTFDDDMVQDAP
jgi:hypothetical protein